MECVCLKIVYIDDVISYHLICVPCLLPTFLNQLPSCNGYDKWIAIWCMFGLCKVCLILLPSHFAATALSCLILVSTLTRMGRGFFLCSFFCLDLPR